MMMSSRDNTIFGISKDSLLGKLLEESAVDLSSVVVPMRVVAAAICVRGKTYSVPAPGRHHDVIRHMRENGVTENQNADWEEGFLLSDGRFARRKAAGYIATRAGQVASLMVGDR